MRYHHCRQVLFLHHLIRQFHDDIRRFGVKCSGVFIQNQKFNRSQRCHNQRCRLSLSAGKRPQLDIHFIFQTQPQNGKLFLIEIFSCLIHTPAQTEGLALIIRQRHILKHCQIWTGACRRVLIDTPNGAISLKILHFCNILAANQHLSFLNGDAAADDIQHGGFARSITADNRNKFAVVHSQIKILKQQCFGNGAGIIDFFDMLQFKHAPHHPSVYYQESK